MAAHLVDHVNHGVRIGRKAVRAAAVGATPYATCCLEIVEGIANGTKHAGPSREADFSFVPGYERYVPVFGLDEPRAGLDKGRWNRAGLVVAHRMAERSEGLGSYFIDDCVCVSWCGPTRPHFRPCSAVLISPWWRRNSIA